MRTNIETEETFFITGGTLATDAPSYIVREADTELEEAMRRGEFCYVLNTRQMGKSSLMVHTARRLREQGTRVAVIDLSAVGTNLTPEQWYYGMLMRLGEQLGLEEECADCWWENAGLGPMQRFMRVVGQVVLPASDSLVIFVDEIDVVRSLPFATDEFFAGIRECYNRRVEDEAFRRLTFCLLGVATPADLITDTRVSPFNIGKRISLQDFTPVEARRLEKGLERAGQGGAQRLLERVLYWTGGHPYMTQRLCDAAARHLYGNSSANIGPELVDRLCEEMFLTRIARDTDDNLAFVRNRLLRSELDLAGLLDLYQRVRKNQRVQDDETNPFCAVLRLSGLLKVENGVLRVRNRIYDRVFDNVWIIEHLPDAERRRQQAAYRRGLLRAASIAATVVLAAGALTTVAVVQARRAGMASRRAVAKTDEATRERDRATRLTEELRQTLARQQQTNRDLQAALRQVTYAQRQALRAQKQAQEGRREAETQHAAASAALYVAEQQKRLATRRLASLHVANANRLMNEGDIGGALPPLLEALKLDAQDPHRTEMHRYRLGNALVNAPRIVRFIACESAVESACFSLDKSRFAAATSGGVVRIWDSITGRALSPPMRHRSGIHHTLFSPDGKRLLTIGRDRKACLWNAATGKPIHWLSIDDAPGRGCWSPDGTRVATTDSNGFSLWQAESGRQIARVQMKGGGVSAAVFSPDGNLLAVVAGGYRALIFDIAHNRVLVGLPCWNGYDAQFSRDGKRVLIAGTFQSNAVEQGARLFDVQTGQPASPLFQGSIGLAACFSPDERRVAVGYDSGSAAVWDVRTGERLTPELPHGGQVVSVMFSSDGQRLLTGSQDGAARVWNIGSGGYLDAVLRHGGAIRTAAFGRDGNSVLTASADQSARLWRWQPHLEREVSRRFSGHSVFVPGNQRFLITTAGTDGNAPIVRDVTTGRRLFSPGSTSEGKIDWYRFFRSADGRRIGVVGRSLQHNDRTGVQIWDSSQKEAPRTAVVFRMSPDVAVLSPDLDKVFESANGTGPLHVYDTFTGRMVYTLPLPRCQFALSLDGRFLVTCSGEQHAAQLREARSGKSLAAPLELGAPLSAASFSPEGKRLFTYTDKGAFRLWDVVSGRPLSPVVMGIPSPFGSAISFSPDGSCAVTSQVAVPGSVLWDLKRGVPIHTEPGDMARRLSSDGQRLLTFADTFCRVYETRGGKRIGKARSLGGALASCVLSENGRRVFLSRGDGKAYLWEPESDHWLALPVEGLVTSAQFSPDGQRLATVVSHHTVQVWDAATGEQAGTAWTPGQRVLADLRFVSDGRALIAASEAGTFYLAVPKDERSENRIRLWGLLLSGQQIHGGQTVSAPPVALKKAWQTLSVQPLYRGEGRKIGAQRAVAHNERRK